ncbi:Fic/DOC family protein [Taklimakanibacter deserti]|uniref:Fic/DOC family protein n=1 Tax=Taklimakanibacter deserti TaxID=2267839 RepID=UPI000E64EEF6
MTYGGYDAFDDPYCYKGTVVLKNKAGLRHIGALRDFELEMSSLRAEEPLPVGCFDPNHYKAIHRHLFQDVYRWAGRYRTVRTAKDGNAFCYPEYIDAQMNLLFARLKDEPFTGSSSFDEFVTAAAEYLAELNAIHPFRDGNGRSQLSFLFLIAARAGYPLDLSRIEPASFLAAMIASFSGEVHLLRTELVRLKT